MDNWYLLTGDINANVAHQFITWTQEQRCLGVKKLTFFISSVGGDIDSAIRIYDFLKSTDLEIITVSFGQIDSAANLIFLAGKERLSTVGCRFFIHEGTYNFGNPKAALHVHDETVRLFTTMQDKVCEIISQETNQPSKNIKTKLRKGTVLTSVEANKIGIVTKIVKTLPVQKTNQN